MRQTPSCRLLFVAALIVSWLPALAGAQQRQLALVGRGPRFLTVPTAGATPVEIDASTSAVLRRAVSLKARKATVGSVLQAIEAQTGLKFVYSRSVVPVDRPVGLRADNITVAAALTEVLLDTKIDVVLSSDGQFTLVERFPGLRGQTATGTIVGRVKSATQDSAAVVRAEVYLPGTRWQALTDSIGWFRLSNVDAGEYTIVVRRLGFAKQTRKVTVREGREDTVNVALAPTAVPLDELVTTATGQQRRRDIGNQVTTIRADSVLQTAAIHSLTDLLEDRVPGLNVQHTSGAPGDPARLRLRGIGSVLRSNDPVVVVDGVRVYAAQSGARSGNLTNLDPGTRDSTPITLPDGTFLQRSPRANAANVPAPSPLDLIDPNTIEKIEVLNGPSAATLYGADAANGVIVVTTKRGKPGPTRWDASVEHGRTTTLGTYPIGYYRWGSDLLTGAKRFCTIIDRQCQQDSLVQFQALNDPSLTLLGHGKRTAFSLTASGGTKVLTYSVTGSYSDEAGLLTLPAFEEARFRTAFNRAPPDWMRQPHRLEEWTVTSNLGYRLGSTADLQLSTTLGRSEQQRTSLEGQVAPMSGTYVDTINGLYYLPKTNSYALGATSSVLRNYFTRQTASSITATTTLNAQWRPRSWFDANGQAGINVIPRDDHLLLPAGLLYATDSGTVVRGTGRSLVSTFNIQGTVHKTLGLGFIFNTSFGANLVTQSTNNVTSSASGLAPGTTSLTNARRNASAEDESSTSVFGWFIEPRISGQRISISTGIRLDGGSNYGTRFTTGTGIGGLLGLPKLNGSWVISEEPWFPFRAIFTSMQLRGAYGQAQVQPGVADRLRLYVPPVCTNTAVDNDSAQLILSTLGNSALRPERSTELEGGISTDLFDSRVSVELTGYRKMQVDALMPTTLPGSVHGGGTVLTNIGNIRNTGVELALGFTAIRTRNLTWSNKLNYSRNSNILVKLGNAVPANKVEGIVEGYPVYGRWARPILGFADQNGDGALQPQEIQVGDSLVFMGRLLPAYTSSLFTTLTLFGGAVSVAGGFSYDAGAMQVDQTARSNWVLVRALVDPSVSLDKQAAVLASTRSSNPTDYGLMQEVSTFRFNSFSMNYRLPMSAVRFLRGQQITIALQGSNLGLHSNYHGKDPDVSAWSAGENIVDTGQLPLPRNWQLKVFMNF